MDTRPPQVQKRQPGLQTEMRPEPQVMPRFPGSGRLTGKTTIVTGGDSGIGEAVAVLFAREGAHVAILYLDETEDARKAVRLVRDEGGECLAIAGDVGDEQFCRRAVRQVVDMFGGVDVLVNNAAEQHSKEDIGEISREQLERTFRTNIFGYFFMTQSVLPHMREGSAIVNTTSVTAYRGSRQLLDYSSTKGAIVAFTRALGSRSSSARSGSTVWRRARSGPLSSPPLSMRRRLGASARTCRWAGRASPTRSRPATCSWPARIPRTSRAKFSTPTEGKSSEDRKPRQTVRRLWGHVRASVSAGISH
jgi:NADP-dependent 3-hydroxy acid dehydrogenase YdfG